MRPCRPVNEGSVVFCREIGISLRPNIKPLEKQTTNYLAMRRGCDISFTLESQILKLPESRV